MRREKYPEDELTGFDEAWFAVQAVMSDARKAALKDLVLREPGYYRDRWDWHFEEGMRALRKSDGERLANLIAYADSQQQEFHDALARGEWP